MNFDHFNFDYKITSGIRSCKFETPTPIQQKAIPVILKGRDIMGLAQTGTGKTAAFALPILQKLLTGPRGKTRALIIAPTRELAEQIQNSFDKMAVKTGLRSLSVYGGVSKVAQQRKIQRGVEIIVACPGRLLDLLGDGSVNLAKVEILVLDEADQMFDMGFLPPIRQILKRLPKERQNLLFSATMPGAISHLAKEILVNPERIQIDHTLPIASVSQKLFTVDPKRKTALLKNIMQQTEMGPTLVFTKTKHKAESLARNLQKAGFRATSLQGNLSQNKRQQALNGFKRGHYKILVATDIAARGIDVSGISHVINYDVPDTVDSYTHRIGRTGRASQTGEAFTFAANEDRRIINMIERTFGKKLLRISLPEFSDYEPDKKETTSKPAQKPFARQRKDFGNEERKSRSAKRNKFGQRQKRRQRAAFLDSGKIFLES